MKTHSGHVNEIYLLQAEVQKFHLWMRRRCSGNSSLNSAHAPTAAEGQGPALPSLLVSSVAHLNCEMCLNLLPSLFSLHCWYSHCFCRSPRTDWYCLIKYISDLDEQSVPWQTVVPCAVIEQCRNNVSSSSWYLLGTAVEANGHVTQAGVCVCGEYGTEQDYCSSGGHGHYHENPQHCQAYYCPPVRHEKVLVETQRISQDWLRKK